MVRTRRARQGEGSPEASATSMPLELSDTDTIFVGNVLDWEILESSTIDWVAEVKSKLQALGLRRLVCACSDLYYPAMLDFYNSVYVNEEENEIIGEVQGVLISISPDMLRDCFDLPTPMHAIPDLNLGDYGQALQYTKEFGRR